MGTSKDIKNTIHLKMRMISLKIFYRKYKKKANFFKLSPPNNLKFVWKRLKIITKLIFIQRMESLMITF